MDTANNWLNLRRVELEVNVENDAGIRLYQKFGFHIEGIKRKHTFGDGGWADSYLMAHLKNLQYYPDGHRVHRGQTENRQNK